MAYIGKKPNDIFRGLATYDTFTGDGSTTTFDVTNVMPDGGQNDVDVIVDNVRQEPGASKSFTLGNDGNGEYKRVTFNVAPDDGSEIYVINPGRTTSLIQVSDDAIVTSKLGADAVTGAKIADDAIDSEHLVDGSVDNVHLANSSITINGTAVSLGGSVTAGTDWQAVVVADGSTQLTAVAGKGYFLDTNVGVIEVFLPASPSRGDTIILADYGGNFATNNVLVNTGGQLIDSTATGGNAGIDYKLTTNNIVVELVYVDSNKGWLIQENEAKTDIAAADDTNAQFIEATGGTVTTSGNFKIHTFTGDGCFVVSSGGNASGSNSVSYLVVAGAGGGGGSKTGYYSAGGGGAGGFREGKTSSDCYSASPLNAPAGLPVTAGTYPVTVGGGGSGGPVSPRCRGNSGSNSIFSTITSSGGGYGGRSGEAPSQNGTQGGGGGSGGGTGGFVPSPQAAGGSGNSPSVSPPQGNNGGAGSTPSAGTGGGGGGATAAGTGSTSGSSHDNAGGAGATTSITGSPVTYAVGGNAGADCGSAADAGTANRGNGGQGGNNHSPDASGGAGGKGVVIIRYKFQSS